MPLCARETLAQRFRQNWLAKNPHDQVQVTDDSLTSLSWLQNLNIMKMASPTPPASPKLLQENRGDVRVDPNSVLQLNEFPQIKQEPGIHPSSSSFNHLHNPSSLYSSSSLSSSSSSRSGPMLSSAANPYQEIHTPYGLLTYGQEKINYKTNGHIKPPYSYATLICMAMKESKKSKITLADIYSWITDNFLYYRLADPSWQNSIRHNLSLNKCFKKVPRRKDEPGKGGFWAINPEHEDMLVNGVYKKRRSSVRENIAPVGPPLKRVKSEPDYPSTSCNVMLSGDSSDNILQQEDLGEVLSGGDFNLCSILHQDIDVCGVRVKTEDIIDGTKDPLENVANPITSFSPPPSDNNSDAGLEDMFSPDFATDLESPVDLISGQPLDLSITGTCIGPPRWWSEAINKGPLSESTNSGLSTPIAPSPVHDTDYSHPWAESQAELDQAIASFDMDIQNMFELNNMES